MTRMIQGYSETMRHLKDGLDVVGDDLAEIPDLLEPLALENALRNPGANGGN